MLKKDYKINKLDLRWGKTDYSLFLSEAEIESFSRDFNYKIELYNKVLKDDLDWWFSPLSARNNFCSPLFHHFICFHICLKLVKSKSLPKICLTDCNNIYLGLLKLKNQGKWHGEISHTHKRSMPGMFLKRLRSLTRVSCHVFVPFLLVKILFRKTKFQRNYTTLVDTFVLPGKEFSDRYYFGTTDYLNNKEISRLRFVPTFHGYTPKKYFSAIKKLLSKPEKFLLKENFLTTNDIFHALSHSIRLFELKIPKLGVGPFNLSSLIKEELGRFGGLEDAVHGFMNFYFAERLKLAGVKVETVVDWHENQGQDRGWNYGFHTFYPKIKMIGYNTVFLSKWHLAISPLPSERKKKVLPKLILTPCSFLIKHIQRNDFLLKVKTTGAFRFPTPKKCIRKTGPIRILVPLSYNSDAALNSVLSSRSLIRDLNKTSDIESKLIFKAHPAINGNSLEAFTKNHHNKIESWTSRLLSEELRTCDIVLGEWSFALLESLNAGVPVGTLRSADGLFHSSIPPSCAKGITVNIDSLDSIMKLVNIALKRRSKGPLLRDSLLEPPTRSLALELFGLQ